MNERPADSSGSDPPRQGHASIVGPDDGLIATTESVARDLHGASGPAMTYQMATDLAVARIGGCDVASLSMIRGDGVIENRAATHPEAAQADQLQADTGEGPCLDAAWREHLVHSPSLAYDPRWTVWGPLVVEHTGLQSAMSLQLFTHHGTLGALNLFAFVRDAFSVGDRSDALALAAHVTIAIAAAERIEHLQNAIDARTVIGQATGIVMERYRLDPERALAVLVRTAAAEEAQLRDVASRLIETGHLAGIES